mmetsp:Transcript_25887/g.33957  ORF Transcript_25887/g.33957 Transcript_25887/m.33957 type:complete len:112 (-) Transcript_25887:282-617(-)
MFRSKKDSDTFFNFVEESKRLRKDGNVAGFEQTRECICNFIFSRVVQAVKNKDLKEITAFEYGEKGKYLTVLKNRQLFSSNSSLVQHLLQKEQQQASQPSVSTFFCGGGGN